jgi:hypothetical protein
MLDNSLDHDYPCPCLAMKVVQSNSAHRSKVRGEAVRVFAGGCQGACYQQRGT